MGQTTNKPMEVVSQYLCIGRDIRSNQYHNSELLTINFGGEEITSIFVNAYNRKAVSSKQGLLLEVHLPFTPLTEGNLL